MEEFLIHFNRNGLPRCLYPLQTEILARGMHNSSIFITLHSGQQPLIVDAFQSKFEWLIPAEVSRLELASEPTWNDSEAGVCLILDGALDTRHEMTPVCIPH